jgi:DNA-binding NtrC family response regulator
LRHLLEGAGNQVVTAENGGDALNLARTKSVDLALLDIRVPEMSGIEVLEELKAHDANVYVIMVSSVEDISTTLEAMGKGAHDYIGKPINARQLLTSVEQALELKRVTQLEASQLQSEKWVRRANR